MGTAVPFYILHKCAWLLHYVLLSHFNYESRSIGTLKVIMFDIHYVTDVQVGGGPWPIISTYIAAAKTAPVAALLDFW
jgi:hypothetical protein